jgi:hypothetical protein
MELMSSQEIWHMKISFKIKIFLWILIKGVLLTKDISLKEMRMGVRLVAFVLSPKQSNIYSLNVIMLWQAVYLVFRFKPPTSSFHLFHGWSKLGGNK